jgi:hypothetical protein
MERKHELTGKTQNGRLRKQGSKVVRLANSHPDKAVEPNSEEAMAIARAVRIYFEDKRTKTPSIWKEKSFTPAEE